MTSLDVAIIKASNELGLSTDLVGKVYKAYWSAIKQAIQSLPLKENLTQENFSKLKLNINIPSLGKLYSSYDRVQGVKKRFEYLKQIRNNDKSKETQTDVH